MLYKVARGICKFLSKFMYKVTIHNVESFDNMDGRAIVCANHLHIFDPVMIACYTKQTIHFMGKKELFDKKVLGYILRRVHCFPVDRKGVSLSAMKHAIKILKEDHVLGIFPEGTRVKEFDINNAKAGISLIAKNSNSKIVPVFIKSDYKFRSTLDIYFGEPKDYFEEVEEKITTEVHEKIGKQILTDIYALGEDYGNN